MTEPEKTIPAAPDGDPAAFAAAADRLTAAVRALASVVAEARATNITNVAPAGYRAAAGTRVFLAFIADRHSSPTAEVFLNAEAAIAYARAQALAWAADPGDIREDTAVDLVVTGWLYRAVYSPENDRVWVEAKTVQL